MEETKLKSFIEKLSLKQLDELQKRIDIRRAALVKTTEEHQEIVRLFMPRYEINNKIEDNIYSAQSRHKL
jgi:hypothetical protein